MRDYHNNLPVGIRSTLRWFMVIMLLVATFSAVAQTLNEDIVFDEKVFDFGKISETGGKVSHRFRFTNTGKTSVTIVRARAGCSCVSAEVPKAPVAPGKSGYITVRFDPDYRPGHFSKEIAVISDGNRYNRIWVKGDVVAGKHPVQETCRYDYGSGLYMDFRRLVFSPVEVGQNGVRLLKYANASDKPVRVEFEVRKADPDYSLSVGAGGVVNPGEIKQVEVMFRPHCAFPGERTVRIVPVVDGKPVEPLIVVLSAD